MTMKELGIINDMPRGWLSSDEWHMSLYNRWLCMWLRCKDPKMERHETYKCIEIDERYRHFSNYVNDVMSLENFDKLITNPHKWVIDKDIKNENRGYFLDNLSIVSKSENSKEMINRCGCPTNKKTPVFCISVDEPYTRMAFDSMFCTRVKNFDPRNIVKCCKGRQKTHKGFKWYYLDVIEL